MASFGRAGIEKRRTLRACFEGGLGAGGAALLAALGAVGCSEGDLNPNDVMAGATSTGGSNASAGGSGNAPSNGGSTASNGGSANPGNGGGGNPGPAQTFTFGSGLEGFAVNWYCSDPPMGTEPGNNCVQVSASEPPPAPVDAGADAGDAGSSEPGSGPGPISNDFVVLAYDAAEGSPEPGSARLTIQFEQLGETVQLAFNTPDGESIDMSGRTLTALVRADVAGASAKMYMKSGTNYDWADSGQVILTPGMWMPAQFVGSAGASPFVATDVREFGLQIETTVTQLTPITIHIDTFEY